MKREEKTAVVEEIAGQIEAANSIFAIDYRGISVPQAAELRAKLREADASFRVVKNRLTALAASKAGCEELLLMLDGPTALAFVRGDTALAAKAITTLDRDWEVLEFKGGLMDGEPLEPDQFTAIARLPGRDALNAQVVAMVASPLSGLVRGLNAMLSGLAIQLQAIADQGLVSGEAPAEEPAAEQTEVEEPAAEEAEEPSSAEETAAEGAPAAEEQAAPQEASADEAPAQEASADKAPAQEASADEAQAEAAEEPAPAEQAPAETAEEPAPAEEQPGAEEQPDTEEQPDGEQPAGEAPVDEETSNNSEEDQE